MMKKRQLLLISLMVPAWLGCTHAPTDNRKEKPAHPLAEEPALQATGLEVTYDPAFDAVLFELETLGDAASIVPEPVGGVDGAPVLGYVFVTTLAPEDVGFVDVEGTVALAATSHPDFDDTPLWDEDNNAAYDDDGAVYHAHWVVLGADPSAPAGLGVIPASDEAILPPTAPMPMYLDSPGFTIVEDGRFLRVLVPADRIKRRADFEVGALVAFMKVDASSNRPALRVHDVLSQIADGQPSTVVSGGREMERSAWPNAAAEPGAFEIEGSRVRVDARSGTLIFTMDVAGRAATQIPTPAGQVDGAPVLGYVFPTTLPPSSVGFADVEGTLALAVTSHPDFDDTPLFDENMDQDYGNDGGTYHVHWAALVADDESGAGLSVPSQQDRSKLPPTAPMPMYLDSPGYHAFARGSRLTVLVPSWHVGTTDFNFDAVTARMRVDASGAAPVLRVEEVFQIQSGDLSLPFTTNTE